jgi:hypothetical protein
MNLYSIGAVSADLVLLYFMYSRSMSEEGVVTVLTSTEEGKYLGT